MFDFFGKNYERIKADYIKRSPKGKWIFIRDFAIPLLKIIGLAILDPNFKVWWYSYFSIVVYINFFSSLIYTIWYYSDDPIQACRVFTLFGVAISVKYMQHYKFLEIFKLVFKKALK